MKKFTLSLSLMLLTLLASAQLNLEGVNDYGRLLDEIYHPTIQNKMYAVTLNSHIVVSNDNGDTWDYFYSYPDASARIIQLEILDNNTLSFVIMGTGVHSNNTLYFMNIDTASIVKQFTPPVTPNATFEWIKDYDVYEGNHDIVLLNSSYKIGIEAWDLVYYTIDGGITWTNIYETDINLNFRISVNNAYINPSNPDNIFICRGNGPTDNDGGLLISTDGGVTFTEKLAGSELNAMAFDLANPNHIYQGSGWGGPTTLYETFDGGDNWSVVPITWDATGVLRQVNYIEINPYNNNDILILAGDEMAISADAGATWANYVYDIDAAETLYVYGLKASYNPFNTSEVLISTDRYPTISRDGGATLEKLLSPFYLSKFVSYNASGDGHLYYGAQDGIVHLDMETGIHSANQIVQLGTYSVNSKKYFPDQLVEGRVYFRNGSGLSASLYKMENHGASITGILRGDFGVNVIDVETNPSNTDEVWMSFDDGQTLIFDTSQNLSFTSVTLPVANQPLPAPQIYHFTTFINPLDGDHILLGQGGRIFESFNKGTTWADLSGGMESFLDADNDIVYDIDQNPANPNELVASTSQGIFKTTNYGDNWIKVFDGTYLRKIEYSTADDDVIVASVYSSLNTIAQFIYSTDNGLTWTVILNSMLEYNSSLSMAYQYESGVVHVHMSTGDSGPLRFSVDVSTLSSGGELAYDNSINIYPNPASNFVNIELKEGKTIEKVDVFSLTGQRVMSSPYTNQLNVSSLQTGIYVLRASDGAGNYFIKKLVIR